MTALIEALNAAAEPWWRTVFHATWQGSLLAVALLAVAGPARRRCSAQFRHVLLLLAMLKFATPPLLSMPTGLFSRLGPTVLLDAAASAAGAAGGTATAAAPALNWQAWLMLAHAAGALGVLAWVLVEVRAIRRLAARGTPLVGGPLCDHLARLAARIGLRRRVRLLVSPDAVSPMAFGVLHPSVLLPASLIGGVPDEEMDTVLMHELAHHRRGDILTNWCQALLLAAWWFNPVFWLLNRAVRATREDACDDLLLSRHLTTDGTYCQALLRVARRLNGRTVTEAAAAFAQCLGPLGSRIRRIMDPRIRRVPGLSFAGAAVVLLLAGLVLPGLRSGVVVHVTSPPEMLVSADDEPGPRTDDADSRSPGITPGSGRPEQALPDGAIVLHPSAPARAVRPARPAWPVDASTRVADALRQAGPLAEADPAADAPALGTPPGPEDLPTPSPVDPKLPSIDLDAASAAEALAATEADDTAPPAGIEGGESEESDEGDLKPMRGEGATELADRSGPTPAETDARATGGSPRYGGRQAPQLSPLRSRPAPEPQPIEIQADLAPTDALALDTAATDKPPLDTDDVPVVIFDPFDPANPFGFGGGLSAAPEPTSLAVVAVGAVAVLLVRRRRHA